MEKIRLGNIIDTFVIRFYDNPDYPILDCSHNNNLNCNCVFCKLFLKTLAIKVLKDSKFK